MSVALPGNTIRARISTVRSTLHVRENALLIIILLLIIIDSHLKLHAANPIRVSQIFAQT